MHLQRFNQSEKDKEESGSTILLLIFSNSVDSLKFPSSDRHGSVRSACGGP